MKSLIYIIVLSLFLQAYCKDKDYYQDKRVKIEIISSKHTISKGDTVIFSVRFSLAKGWHIYWLNPGDAGEPTKISVFTNLPQQDSLTPLYPIPNYSSKAGIVTFDYHTKVDFPFKLYIPQDFANNTLTLAVKANWLICREGCIPGKANFSKKFVLGKRLPNPQWDTSLLNSISNLTFDTLFASIEFLEEYALLRVAPPSNLEFKSLFFFPLSEGIFKIEPKLTYTFREKYILINLPLIQYLWGDKSSISGILEFTLKNSTKKYFFVKCVY